MALCQIDRMGIASAVRHAVTWRGNRLGSVRIPSNGSLIVHGIRNFDLAPIARPVAANVLFAARKFESAPRYPRLHQTLISPDLAAVRQTGFAPRPIRAFPAGRWPGSTTPSEQAIVIDVVQQCLPASRFCNSTKI